MGYYLVDNNFGRDLFVDTELSTSMAVAAGGFSLAGLINAATALSARYR